MAYINKKLILTFVACATLSSSIIGELRAESTIVTSYDCGKVSGTVSCNLYDDGTLRISGSGKMLDYKYIDKGENVTWHNRYTTDAPWAGENITKVVVDDKVTSIGAHAFTGNKTIKSVEGMKDVTSIGPRAFFDNTNLEHIDMPSVRDVSYETFYYASKLTNAELPEAVNIGADAFLASGIESIYLPKVTTLLERALRGMSNLTSVDLPSVTSIGDKALASANLAYIGLPEGTDVAFGDNVFSSGALVENCSNDNRAACGSCGNGYVMSGLGCVADCGVGYLGKEGRCIDAANGCGENYRQIENWCNRIRYTPAEAAKVLNDDDNSITITFKK